MQKQVKEVQIWISPKEFQFLNFIRKNVLAGKIEVIIHNHEPQKIIIKEPEIWFDGKVNDTDLTKIFYEL